MKAILFDRVAPHYDRLNTILSFGIHPLWRRALVRALPKRAYSCCLDLATGTGDMIRSVQKHLYVERYIGVDPSAKMLLQAEKKLGKEAFFYQGSAEGIPCASESVDLLVMSFGLRNMDEPDKAWSELFRVLKPGGILGLLELGPGPWVWGFKTYLRLMPKLALLFGGDQQGYEYLQTSLEHFLTPQSIRARIEQEGFHLMKSKSLWPGCCHLFVATRPLSEPKSIDPNF